MKKEWQDQIRAKIVEVQAAIAKSNPIPYNFGHAFLWGKVEVKLKNGKTRQYRTCLGGSVCATDLDALVQIAESVPGVSNVSYNLD